jgi:hypothetical protein
VDDDRVIPVTGGLQRGPDRVRALAATPAGAAASSPAGSATTIRRTQATARSASTL